MWWLEGLVLARQIQLHSRMAALTPLQPNLLHGVVVRIKLGAHFMHRASRGMNILGVRSGPSVWVGLVVVCKHSGAGCCHP